MHVMHFFRTGTLMQIVNVLRQKDDFVLGFKAKPLFSMALASMAQLLLSWQKTAEPCGLRLAAMT